ncbi:MAG TPA: EAL domain-containing protein [Gammaproteobacteria bacterium]|nr:EAL domain-containing protein [Gammaproteobacteria bacterium]
MQHSASLPADRQQLLFEMNPDPVAEFDIAGRFIDINPAWRRISGYNADELRGLPLETLVGAECIGVARQHFADAAAGTSTHCEIRCQHRDGSSFEVDITLAPLNGGGSVSSVYGIAREISARKRRENHIRVAASALANMIEAVVITDPERRIVWVNPAFTAITGYPVRAVVGRTPKMLCGSVRDREDYERAVEAVRGSGHWQDEITCVRENGERFTSLISINAVRDERGEIMNYVDVLTDVSALKNYQSRVDFLVSHDPLTRLPGRSLFEHDLVMAIEQARADHETLGIAVIGLDGFRMINDSLGHEAGDAVLREVAKRLTDNLREIDTVARLSGDQFAVMLPNAADADNIGLVVNKLFKQLAEPFVVHGDPLFVSASAGISCYPKDGGDAATLTQNADAAMYQAKRLGRNTYRFYDARINRKVHDRLRIANNLRQAAERKEFILHYQPSIRLDTGDIVGVEALLRWQHPKLGLMLPGRFIGLAEDTGLIRPLGNWVLKAACRQAVEWQQQGHTLPRIAVNLSVSQLRQPDIVERIKTILEMTGLPPHHLELEITESMLMDDPAAYRAIISELNEMGITIAIDDFGTGYSSLAYLRDLPVDCLKIDRTFVAGIPNDEHQMAITRAIISMAKTLGKRIVAEGIETEAQLEFLRAQGCDEGQGFLISRPCDPDSIEDILSSKSASRRPAPVTK